MIEIYDSFRINDAHPSSVAGLERPLKTIPEDSFWDFRLHSPDDL